MPRGSLSKVDALSRVLKLKNSLYGNHKDKGKEWHDGAHDALSSVLDTISEYSQ